MGLDGKSLTTDLRLEGFSGYCLHGLLKKFTLSATFSKAHTAFTSLKLLLIFQPLAVMPDLIRHLTFLCKLFQKPIVIAQKKSMLL
jgi:hypothetical protein